MNKKFAFCYTVLSLFLIAPISLIAQKDPMKFGRIDKADLEMKVYPSDTSAVAAILCDYGFFNSGRFEFIRTIRIKIFKKEGTVWGNHVFPVSSDANIRGITYNLENGEIVESKLKSESVFKETVTKNYHRKRIAMPNVKEGSIIDLEFSFKGLPREWRFQDEIPVRWSELIIEQNPNITFRKNFFGSAPLSINTDSRWVGKDMPAFKKEPYMNSWENFISKFEIEILSINFPGFYQGLTSTWEAVNHTLMESDNFGKAITRCAFFNSTAKEIEKKYSTPMERLIAAHEAVKKAIKWDENESAVTSSVNLSYCFNKKIGNSGDVNLSLIGLLKKLDFEVYPVALSTRSNGFLSPFSPSLNKMNYVIAYVSLNDKKYFLDATDNFVPVGMLPRRCINLQGRIIDKDQSNWVDLTCGQKDKETITYELKINDQNELEGKIFTTKYEYAAYDFRKKYEKFNSKEEYLKDFESENKGLSVLDYTVTNLDSIYSPLKETYNIKIRNVATTSGNQIFINPMLFEQITSNPFKSEDRKYPVDFVYPSDLTYVLKLELPKGIEVIEVPKDLSAKLKDGSAILQYQAMSVDKYVTLAYRLIIKKPIYTDTEYGDLRALFSEMVKKHSEQITLKRL